MLALCLLSCGCGEMNEPASQHEFLGIAEDETSGEGPVGLIDGQPIRVNSVSKVREVSREDYLSAKAANRLVAEEEHAGYVYWAVKEDRDVPFENATAWVTVLERYKSRLK